MQVPTGFEVLSLVVLTLGVVLSIWEGSIAGSPTGICIALASTFCGAAMLSFSGKVTSHQNRSKPYGVYSTAYTLYTA